MASYEVLESNVTHEGHLARVRVDTLRMPDGSSAEREVVEQDDAVAVLALTPEREVVLLRQYRHPFGAELLELPAGKLDVPGEDPAAAAQRELVEETGLAAEELSALLHFHNSAGWTDEATTIYLASGLRETDAPEDYTAEHEEAHMQVLRVPLDEAVAMVHRGEIRDAKTVIGILLAALRQPA
jgi:8-oxo-dGDP phosphatase